MIKFPDSTLVNKVVPKNAFYKNMGVNANMKDHFVNDVERIVWAYKLAPSTINVLPGTNVLEITVFFVTLKEKECPNDVFVFIDKNIARHTVFVLSYENEQCVLVNYKEKQESNNGVPFKVTKTYQSDWISEDSSSLQLEGSNMDLIYENIVRETAGLFIKGSTESLKHDIEESQIQEKLRKEIQSLKAKINAEKQPQKKFLLHKQLKHLEKKLI